jgi:hypothetical protein
MLVTQDYGVYFRSGLAGEARPYDLYVQQIKGLFHSVMKALSRL